MFVEKTDPELFSLVRKHARYESSTLKMIASENYMSEAVLEASGNILANKYAEGYPTKRYYEGTAVIDEIEQLAQQRLVRLFGAEHANVQPYSGSPANGAAYRALVKSGDTIMGLPVTEGGHLTHGWPVNFSGIDHRFIAYRVNPASGVVDFDEVRELALRERPKLIWVGGTAYPRLWDYAAAASIAKEVEAYLVADIAHISGLILAGVHPNPVPHSHVVTSTSHKTLRGPRGGFILSRVADEYQAKYHADSTYNLAQRVDRAVFPTLQGGPHVNTISALAVALREAETESFKEYGRRVVANSRALAAGLLERGYQLVSGGTDNHMLIMDLRDRDFSGKKAAQALAAAGIIANFNMVPGDPRKPAVTSGVRIGTAALSTLGMGTKEMAQIAGWIDSVLKAITDEARISSVRAAVAELAAAYPPPGYEAAPGAEGTRARS